MTGVPGGFRLDGEVAVVTGASSGLGAHFARLLASAGAAVAIGARRAEELETVRRSILADGGRCVAVATDVSDPARCRALVDAAVTEWGRVDVLVNNAGVGYGARAEKDDPGRAAGLLEVNLLGAYQMAVAAGRVMIDAGRGGSIINIASALGLTAGSVPQAAYSASKAGLMGLTRDLAAQWSGRHGIRVNTLAPGYFASEMTAPLLEHEQGLADAVARIPLGRFGDQEELAGPLLLLASRAGSYITGTTLCVDGGWTMH
ncbi:NAD(P)-dependent dehydrogenase, short-chain alcohol dehydrogenase family [Pseudonocardia ammonioxydans]|uniref:NAD(P)-dependent dehydrogenase, short-chain alcohol dehydrogenase family n=1 Tax=Pseudonocardia ammonioxydans TaxID=260086 RepID=A0A1I5FI95_PSUAM|nr:SDR family oxidoreductase [Pseudonocardia ammonioxydans]SFO23432.1 NAD(P)-dependent dehydrogenase, short-chain alcohol dehydrogenase family [Pseudonocardia ammonioxydans]